MSGDLRDRELRLQMAQQGRQRVILRRLEGVVLQPLQLNAYRVIVAVVLALPAGTPSVPCAVQHGHKLDYFTAASDDEVRRHLQSPNLFEVGVCRPVELIGEELLDLRATILARRKADGMDDGQ